MYLQRREILARDGFVEPRVYTTLREIKMRQRQLDCEVVGAPARTPSSPPNASSTAVHGVLTHCLDAWMEKTHGDFTYKIIQILTGHGVFESYLYEISRRVPGLLAQSGNREHCSAYAPALPLLDGTTRCGTEYDMRRTYKAVVRAIMCSQDNWNICKIL